MSTGTTTGVSATPTGMEGPSLYGTVRRTPVFVGRRTVPFFQRALAKSIDVTIAVAFFYIGRFFHPWLGLSVCFFYLAFKDGFGSGQSIGKKVVGIRVNEDALGMAGSFKESLIRNLALSSAALLLSTKVLWIVFILISVPWLLLEAALTFFLPTGVRLGDIMANTVVDEVQEEFIGSQYFP